MDHKILWCSYKTKGRKVVAPYGQDTVLDYPAIYILANLEGEPARGKNGNCSRVRELVEAREKRLDKAGFRVGSQTSKTGSSGAPARLGHPFRGRWDMRATSRLGAERLP